MKTILLLMIFVFPLLAQTFEEYQKQQQAEFEEFQAEEKAAFEAALRQQQTQLRQWETEARKYVDDNLNTVSVRRANNRSIARSKHDFAGGKVEVSAVAVGKTKKKAIQTAMAAASDQLKRAITEADSSIESEIDKSSLKKFAAVKRSKAKVETRKSKDAFVAEVKVTKPTNQIAASTIPKKGKVPAREYKGNYTGVVVDARELQYRACLIPIVQDAEGNQLYGPRHVEKEKALEGMVEWTKNMSAALKSDRAGKNPLVMKASKVVKKRRLLAGELDAKDLGDLAGSSILRECKVVVVVN